MTGTRLPFLLTMERTFPILDVAPTGAGVGYPDGVRTFVPGALPGDVVACDWTPPEKGRQSQVIDRFEFVERAAKRAPEPCPHLCGAPACGGCPLGTLLYREQCRLKAKLLEDACRAAGREEWAKLVTPPELFVKQRAFRNKAFFTPLRTTEGIRFGMYAAGSHEKVALDTCPQLPAWMNECQRAAARVLSEALADRPDAVYDETRHTGILRGLLLREGTLGRMAVFVVKDLSPALEETLGKLLAEELRGLSLTSLLWGRYDARGNRTTGEDFTAIEGAGRVETELLGLTFFVGPDTFLQVNPSETERLYKKVLERASVGPEDKVLDLYSGVGTITLLLAQSAARAFGVEISEASVAAATENAAKNGLKNVDFLASPVGDALDRLPFTPDVIVADPAFKGMEEGVPARLAALGARRLVYVSCNPKTFVRDALALEAAGLRLAGLETVDLFPGALHVETIGTFERV